MKLTPSQTLSLNKDGLLQISNGNNVTLPDNSDTNEIQVWNFSSSNSRLQFLSLAGNTLEISNGNSVNLPQYIQEVNAGFGLTGGGSTSPVVLAVDENVIQRRVGSCAIGYAIQSIDQNGTVTCEPTPWNYTFPNTISSNKPVSVSASRRSVNLLSGDSVVNIQSTSSSSRYGIRIHQSTGTSYPESLGVMSHALDLICADLFIGQF